jgi:hypothetical protein
MNKRQLLIDTLIAEAVFTDPLVKNAEGGALSSLANIVVDYVGSHIDPNNKVGSVLDLIAVPTLIALGGPFRVLGWILEVSEQVFDFNISKIIEAISGGVKGLIGNGGQASSEQVTQIVQDAVENGGGGTATQQEYDKFVKTESLSLQDAYMLNKYAEDYKMAAGPSTGGIFSNFARYLLIKNKTRSLFIAILSVVIRAILWSGGFMIAGDAFNAVMGRKNHFDGSADKRKPEDQAQTVSMTPGVSHQKVFVVSPNYHEENLNNKYNQWVVGGPVENIDDYISAHVNRRLPPGRG